MKQFIRSIFLLGCLFVYSVSLSADTSKKHLVILNWSEFLAPSLVDAFEKKYEAKVKEVYFESDDARDQILLQTKGKGFDLILVNGSSFRSYRKKGWLQPIPLEEIENFKYIEKRWINAFDSVQGYSVPYFWGTLGIAYRKDLLVKPIERWSEFFNPSDELKGKIIVVKSSADIIGMALKSLGYSANSENHKELDQAKALLLQQKPHVAKYGYINLDENSALVKGDIVATMVYGGDALNVGEHHDQIVYVLPEEGGNIWVDYFAMSSEAANYDLAIKFLDFINDPEWAAVNAEETYLATPNTEAKKLLSDEFVSNPVIFPDNKTLEKSEFFKTLSPRAMRHRTSIFTRVVE